MKVQIPVVLFSLAAAAVICSSDARPDGHGGDKPPPPKLLSEKREEPEGPKFKYSYEVDNGIKVAAEGKEGPMGGAVIKGSYKFVLVGIFRYSDTLNETNIQFKWSRDVMTSLRYLASYSLIRTLEYNNQV